MNDLKLISKTTPAVVSFNYEELSTYLDEVLQKYSGLVFTEDTVSECKKTIAELKKGKKSLNDFKIKTKKILTEDITKFENQCKLLSDKFDTVIDPIGEQANQFEVRRKEDKRVEIQTLIDALIVDRDLNLKYYEPLIITEQMLNKGTTIKSITADLTKQADMLLSQQNIEKANIELIKVKVEIANAEYGVTLPTSIYLRLLENDTEVEEIKALIIEDAEKAKIKAEEAEAERIAIEERKAERLAKIEADRVAQAAQRELNRVANEAINAERQAKLEEEKAKVVIVPPIEDKVAERSYPILKGEPVEIVSPKNIDEEIFVDTYEIEGTEAQLNALEDYLNANNFTWKVV